MLEYKKEKELLDYAIKQGCIVYINCTFYHSNKLDDKYNNFTEKPNDLLNNLSYYNSWVIVIDNIIILCKHPYNNKIYFRSSILNNYNCLEKYNCGVTLDKMKIYIDHQIKNKEKLKRRIIQNKIKKNWRRFYK